MPRDLTDERNEYAQQQDNETSEDSSSERPAPLKVSASSVLRSSSPRTRNSEPDPTVKPYVQSLTKLDIESCLKLEEATFPSQERCTRDKVSFSRRLSLRRNSFFNRTIWSRNMMCIDRHKIG